jgi:hypothetical protein
MYILNLSCQHVMIASPIITVHYRNSICTITAVQTTLTYVIEITYSRGYRKMRGYFCSYPVPNYIYLPAPVRPAPTRSCAARVAWAAAARAAPARLPPALRRSRAAPAAPAWSRACATRPHSARSPELWPPAARGHPPQLRAAHAYARTRAPECAALPPPASACHCAEPSGGGERERGTKRRERRPLTLAHSYSCRAVEIRVEKQRRRRIGILPRTCA